MALSLTRSFLAPDNTLKDADNLMGKYKISGVPITEKR